jgi:hypothetical protein
MRTVLILLALALSGAVRADAADPADAGAAPELLEQVRAGFGQASESIVTTRELLRLLAAELPGDRAAWPPVLRAYHAALQAVMGKHALGPWQKYRRVKVGLAECDGLAESFPDSLEIRMLRYSTCRQLPEFFGTHPQAAADLAALLDMFERNADSNVPAPLRHGYIRWILDHGQPAPGQRTRLEKLLGP